jgi:hypothetical protein
MVPGTAGFVCGYPNENGTVLSPKYSTWCIAMFRKAHGHKTEKLYRQCDHFGVFAATWLTGPPKLPDLP